MASDAPDNSQQPPEAPNGPVDGPTQLPAGAEAKLASPKDTSLREFLNKVDDCAPIVRSFLTFSRNTFTPCLFC